jgi:hypothetical protein
LVRQPGTRDLVFFSVGQPPEASMFFASEKAARSEALGDLTSQNSEDPDKTRYRGSVKFVGERTLQVSVSGLKPDEDVAIAIKILSSFFNVPARNICRLTSERGGIFPVCFVVEGNYLYDFIKEN